MYGSIRKSYGAKASTSSEKKERKSIFAKKTSSKFEKSEFQDTSYINVDSRRVEKNVRVNVEKSSQNFQNNSGKSEFPIASVILTIVFTMMVMVLAFGFGG